MGFTDRKFGVELEFDGPKINNGNSRYHYSWSGGEAVLAFLLGSNGFVAGGQLEQWSIKEDGSVTGDRGAYEIATPPLSGVAGLKQLRKLANLLKKHGCTTNRTCGVHVHVDASDLSSHEILAVAARYNALEEKIDRVMTEHRRGDRASYCQPIDYLNNLTWAALRGEKRSALCCQKYRKVNVAAVLNHGTIEFRHHDGCLDAKRLTAWVKFCINFVEETKKRMSNFTADTSKLPEPQKAPDEYIDYSLIPEKYRDACKYTLRRCMEYSDGCYADDVAYVIRYDSDTYALLNGERCHDANEQILPLLPIFIHYLNVQLKGSPYTLEYAMERRDLRNGRVRLHGYCPRRATQNYLDDISFAYPDFSKDCPLKGLQGTPRTIFKEMRA